ncbi:hypothetical protein MKK84_11915, partial [Methylobacterium sp. E-065]|uniref:hypothetical protein n=1 Tax=Methylobacterium sp. E-065 TaxID=2836583 RepID=UPI001FBB8FC6
RRRSSAVKSSRSRTADDMANPPVHLIESDPEPQRYPVSQPHRRLVLPLVRNTFLDTGRQREPHSHGHGLGMGDQRGITGFSGRLEELDCVMSKAEVDLGIARAQSCTAGTVVLNLINHWHGSSWGRTQSG